MRAFCSTMFCALALSSFAQDFDFAKLLGGVSGDARGQGIVRDNSGNIFMKGVFSGGLKIGSATYQANSEDAFICKNDINGNFQWFKKLGFSLVDVNFLGDGDIAVDASNNIYVVGSFQGDATIEGNPLLNAGSYDVYISKYDQNGNLIWVRNIGGSGLEVGNGISVDAGGAVYVSGNTQSNSWVFNGITVNPGFSGSGAATFFARLNPDGSDDWIQFIASGLNKNEGNDLVTAGAFIYVTGRVNQKAFVGKYSATDGSGVWDTETNGSITQSGSTSESFAIALDGTILYLTGEFRTSTLTFGALPSLNNLGSADIFVASFDTDGNPLNAVSYGSTDRDGAKDISVTPGGSSIVITGLHTNTIDIGTTTLTNLGTFVAKLNSSFVPVDVTGFEATNSAEGLGVAAVQSDNAVYVTGSYSGHATLDGNETEQKHPTFFIQKYNLGTFNEQFAIASPKGELVVQFIETSNSDNIYVSGYFDGTVDLLGDRIVSSESSNDEGNPLHDLFIAKLNADASLDWVITAGSLGNDEMYDFSADEFNGVAFHASFQSTPTVAGLTLTTAEIGNVVVKLGSIGGFEFVAPFPIGNIGAIEIDRGDGEVWVAGSFSGSINLGSLFVSNGGSTDIFLAKLDATGSIPAGAAKVWGGTGEEYPSDLKQISLYSITTMILTGYFNSPIDFDGTVLTPNGVDIFVTTIDDFLNADDSFNDGGPNDQFASKLAIDENANSAVIAGSFDGAANFGGVTLNGGIFPSSSFLVSYSNTGTFNWAKQITSSTSLAVINDVVVDGNNRASIVGSFSADLNFDGTAINALGDNDGFYAQYDNNSNLLYVEGLGGNYVSGAETFTGFDSSLGVTAVSNDHIWITGTLSVKQETFGPFTLKPYSVDKVGESKGLNSYLVKFNPISGGSPTSRIYWTEEMGNQINRSNIDGTFFEQYYSGFSIFPQGIAYDYVSDFIYWTDTNGKVRRGKIGGSAFEYFEDFINESSTSRRDNLGIALDISNDKIYWVSNWEGKIKSASLSAPVPMSTIQTVISGLNNPIGVAIDNPNGKIYYTENDGASDNNAEIHSANLDGTNDIIEYSYNASFRDTYAHDIKLDLVNNRVFWTGGRDDDDSQDDTGIYFSDLSDVAGTVTFVPTPEGLPLGMELDLTNNYIYWVSKGFDIPDPPVFAEPAIVRSNIDGSNPVLLRVGNSDGIFIPNFLTLDTDVVTSGCSNPAVANAGIDQAICEGSIVLLSGVVTNSPGSTWTSVGDGTFDNTSALSTNYTPGTNDITSGTVMLTLTANDPDGSGPCASASSMITITIDQSATVDTGPDLLICPSDVVTLNALVGGSANNLLWSSTGSGSFSANTSAVTTYTPDSNDLLASSIDLILTADAVGVCPPVSDQLTLTIAKPINAADLLLSVNVQQVKNLDIISNSAINTGDVITVTILQGSIKGSIIVKPDNTVDYTANNGTVGSDSFQYRICNQCALCSQGTVTIDIANASPVFTAPTTTPQVIPGESIVISIPSVVSDLNGNIDLTSFSNFSSTVSASFSYDPSTGELTVDYTDVAFTVAQDNISFSICDLLNACVDVTLQVNLNGEITVFNGVSPNGDGMNEYFNIQSIQFIEPVNNVTIYNRWGDKVFEMDNYNSLDAEKRFEGRRNNGTELTSGVYFYRVEFPSGRQELTGYLTLKK